MSSSAFVANICKLDTTVVHTGGLQWFQLKPCLKIVLMSQNLFMNCMGDNKITNSYTRCIILGLFLLAKLHTFVFEIIENAIILCMISASKIIIVLMSTSAILLQNLLRMPGLVRLNCETMSWSDFIDSLLASLL